MEKYVTGEFTDYEGKIHHFVIYGIVQKCFTGILNAKKEDKGWFEYEGFDAEKVLSIGISICNPLDKFDERIGILQSKGRALKCRREEERRQIFVTKSGMLNEKVVDAILTNTAEALVANPGLFIKGYNSKLKKWKESQQV